MRGRRGFAALAVVLVGLCVVTPLIMYAVFGNAGAVLRTLPVGLFGVASIWVGLALRRRMGRKLRTHTAQCLRRPSRWSELDRALDAHEIRTGTPGPLMAYYRCADVGTHIDAELVFADPAAFGLPQETPLRSVLDARSGDVPVVAFTEAMLDSFTSSQLLAVIVHLLVRAQLLRESRGAFDNGACEADSRTLLVTHDHVGLLSAMEACTKWPVTIPPTFGIVKFSDADLRSRGGRNSRSLDEWESRDRLAALRAHLGPAALDFPSSGVQWLSGSAIAPVNTMMIKALGALMIVLALAAVVLAVLLAQSAEFSAFAGGAVNAGRIILASGLLVAGAIALLGGGIMFLQRNGRSPAGLPR